MLKELDIKTDPRTAAIPDLLEKLAAKKLGVSEQRIKGVDIVRRSIDARQKQIWVNLRLLVHLDKLTDLSEYNDLPSFAPLSPEAPSAIIVGAGPAGLFAALEMIERGVRPIMLERGKDVDSRRKDLAKIAREDKIDAESNYAFGEGGAGTFSDGKLFTRSKKRGNINKILQILVAHGAPQNILVDAHPHIGTNLLPEIIKSIRKTIENCGGKVLFQKKVTELLLNSEKTRVIGVKTGDGEEFHGPVILATGHSARDVYRYLAKNNVLLEPKGIAVGVRLEHPSNLIDCLQYHSKDGRGLYLPPAEYSFLSRVGDRAVYSFCMCPGGVVVPAATDEGQIVVNGMSSSSRGGRWSNSGMVVEVLPEDIPGKDPLRVMDFQEGIEKRFSADSKGSQNAPAQRMTDFVAGKDSVDLPPTSYAPGVHPARIDLLLPDGIASRLKRGFELFNAKKQGFLTHDAVLIGAETRTSAPVRVPRNPQTLNHVSLQGLYPAGEGAGYAGGIVSAALDGQKCASAVADHLSAHKDSDE